MYICQGWVKKKTNLLFEWNWSGKAFELSAVELVDTKMAFVCIYRSPESDR
jgi:hypothetical protein